VIILSRFSHFLDAVFSASASISQSGVCVQDKDFFFFSLFCFLSFNIWNWGSWLWELQAMWGWRLRSSLIHLRTKSLSWQEQTRFLAIQKDAGFEEQKEAEVEEKGQVCETWTWGKGEDGQLGLGKEDTERLPSLIESLQLPVLSNFTRSPMPGVLRYPESALLKDPASWTASSSSSHEEKSGDDFMGIRTAMRYLSTDAHANIPREAHSNEVGIACGLFHSCLWENGNLWVWGKGDGGRLGLGGEDSMYSPVLNPNIAGVKMVALGGLHSAAVTEDGSVYTW
jgi:hypothetical protein